MILDRAAAPSATSVAEDGSVERAEFIGAPGSRIFTYLHAPVPPARGAVLICSPLHGEFVRNYRREVVLGRELARLGLAALRFHYRFTGNSDGDEAGLTFESMADDALAGVEVLRTEFPSAPLFIVGTRWGALIAASAGRRHPDAGVILWEPMLEAARFFKDAFRRQLVRDLRRGDDAPTSGRELEERLRSGLAVDVVAHRLTSEFYRSCVDRSLEAELGTAPRRMLVVQVGSTGEVRPDLGRLVSRWVEAGVGVDAEARRGDQESWLSEDRFAEEEIAQALTGELIDVTARWISERAGGEEPG